jgi:NADPH:quinone reductase-like Zn-dependent oxidoreductase
VSPRRPSGGAQAQQIQIPALSVAPIKSDSDLVSAATVPMNALTGLLCLDLLGLDEGQTLLVTGPAGMLGSLAVELGLQAGLNVLANAGEADHEFLRGLGLKTFLPRSEGLEEAIRAVCPDGVDGVIDGALIGREISHLVRDGGGIVSPRAAYQIEDPRLKIDYVQVTSGVEDAEKIARIGRLYDEGKLTPRVAANGVFPYTDAAAAYRMAQLGGFRGRVVITFGD